MKESNMASQHTTPQSTKPIVRTVLVLVAAIVLVVSLDQSVAELSNHLGSAAREAIALLPSLLLTASQALQPEASAHHQFSLCSLQMLLSWPLLQIASKFAVA
jgi:hypothetical protein